MTMKFQPVIDKSKPEPVYLQIKEQLRRQIRRDNLPPGTMMPSVKMVASASGVSLRTADLAMQALVDEGICFRRPKKGTFVGETQSVVRPLCGIWSSYTLSDMHQDLVCSQLYRGISGAAVEKQFEASMFFNDPEKTIRIYEKTDAFDFRGVLVLNARHFQRMLELARLFPDKKFVFLNYRMRKIGNLPENVHAVINNDFSGAYRLAEHFISSGLRSMALFTWKLPNPDDLTYQERLRGYCQAAADYALDFDPLANIVEASDQSPPTQSAMCYLVAKKYLRSKHLPDIIFATNDFLADGIKRCIADEGLTGRVQVAGYDCLNPELSMRNGFSSVQVDYTGMGHTGVEILSSSGKKYMQLIQIEPKLNIIA